MQKVWEDGDPFYGHIFQGVIYIYIIFFCIFIIFSFDDYLIQNTKLCGIHVYNTYMHV